MDNGISLVDEMRHTVIARKIKLIGFAIIFGLVIIYSTGMLVASNNVNRDLAMLNLVSVIVCPILCILSVYLRKARLKSVTRENFNNTYVGIHIVSFALCDMGALFCIVTNLFINYNFIYATFGLLVSLLYIWLNFPKDSDLSIINSRSKNIPE